MFCQRCGSQVPDDASFCATCGFDLAATTPIAAVRDSGKVTDLQAVQRALANDYEIIGELGRGGMAIVYRAREKMLDREVALKVLPFSLAFDEEFVERFQREARTAARLEHPNIIPVYRVGKADNVIYFAMRYLRGQSLAQVIENTGALEPNAIRQILTEAASALGYAHHHNIVHRDVKPDNIMFKQSGHVVVCDFGIAKAAKGTRLTGTGMAIGTPYYMSPEQARAQSLDGRSDLYSLGVVAYQCLTGSVPFDGDDSFSIGYKHVMDELPTPDLNATEEKALFGIIQRMMAKDPADRFQSADEVIQALGEPVRPSLSSAPTTPLEVVPRVSIDTPPANHVPPTPTTPMPHSTLAGAAAPKKKRTGLLVGAFAFLLLGGIGGGGYYYVQYMGGTLPLLGARLAPGEGEGDTAASDSTADVVAPGASAMGPVSDSAVVGGAGPPTQAEPDSVPILVAATPVDAAGGSSATPLDSGSSSAAPPSAMDTTAPAVEPPERVEPPLAGVLVLTGLGRNARLWIDGEPARGLEHTLSAGSHTVRVQRAGFRRYTQTVNIAAGDTVGIRVRMRAAAVDPPEPQPVSQCREFGDTYNLSGDCFDSRPAPRDAPLVPLTAEIERRPSPAVLVLQIDASGDVMRVQALRPSDDPRFTILAIQFARTLKFRPAQKNGRAIMAWTQQPFLPGRRR